MTAVLLALALLLLAMTMPVVAGETPRLLGGGLFDARGDRIGEVRASPYGGVDVYDRTGRRIGIGRESPIDGTIRVYDPRTGQPLYEIRPPRAGGRRP